MIRLMTPMLLLCAALFAAPAVADESAEDIVRTSGEKRFHGNSVQTMRMVQTTKSGQTKEKTMEMSTRVVDGRVETHAMFVLPEEMKGSQLLSLDKGDGTVERWMYMSALDNLNQIEDSGKPTSFLGTDFYNEDLELGDADAGTHALVGDETITVGGKAVDCHKIESTPNAAVATAYGKIVTWIEKGNYAPRRVDLFAKEDPTTEFKRLTFEGIAVENGAVLHTHMLMENLAKETSTRIEVTEYRLDVPADELPDTLFDPQQLQAQAAQ